MAYYLRDERITNLSINGDNLAQLSAVFSDRVNSLNANAHANGDQSKRAFLTYIIRFDNKGYRVFSLEDLLRYFKLAKEIERDDRNNFSRRRVKAVVRDSMPGLSIISVNWNFKPDLCAVVKIPPHSPKLRVNESRTSKGFV